MEHLVPIEIDTLKDKYWSINSDYQFAQAAQWIELSLFEFLKATHEYPIFVATAGGRCFPIALLGINENNNSYVNAHGRWIATYTPAAFRASPFVMRQSHGEAKLHIDTKIATISDAASGNAFYTGESYASTTDKISQLLTHCHTDKKKTYAACDALRDLDILTPWKNTPSPDSFALSKKLQLSAVDGAKLEQLNQDQIEVLYRSGALWAAHCMVLSQQHLGMLAKRHAAKTLSPQNTNTSAPQQSPVDEEVSNKETISLDAFF